MPDGQSKNNNISFKINYIIKNKQVGTGNSSSLCNLELIQKHVKNPSIFSDSIYRGETSGNTAQNPFTARGHTMKKTQTLMSMQAPGTHVHTHRDESVHMGTLLCLFQS